MRLAVAFGFLSTAWACTLLNSLDEYGPGKVDAAVPAAETGPIDTCNHAEPPAKPAADDSNTIAKLVFAVDSLYIGAPPDAGSTSTIGFDLDHDCTCPGPSSCNAAPAKNGADAGPKCDGPNGIDNSGAQLIQTIVLSAGSDGNANQAIASGTKGLLIQLAGYNGGQNDTEVQVTFFATNGTDPDGDGNHVHPQHNGNDSWTVRKDSLFGGTGDGPPYIGQYRDDHAYITNGQLVAHVDFPLSFGNLDATLNDTVVTAQVLGSGSTTRLLDGRFIGRWITSDLLTSLSGVADPSNVPQGGLCGASAIYKELKSEICAAVDLRGHASEDNQSPLLNCNALGMVMSFTAEVAKLGEAVTKDEPNHYCGADYKDSCP